MSLGETRLPPIAIGVGQAGVAGGGETGHQGFSDDRARFSRCTAPAAGR